MVTGVDVAEVNKQRAQLEASPRRSPFTLSVDSTESRRAYLLYKRRATFSQSSLSLFTNRQATTSSIPKRFALIYSPPPLSLHRQTSTGSSSTLSQLTLLQTLSPSPSLASIKLLGKFECHRFSHSDLNYQEHAQRLCFQCPKRNNSVRSRISATPPHTRFL